MTSKESRERRERAELKVLYLIQLWSDTFMMYEDTFPQFLAAYRLLRKEGVKFPERDPATRFMLSSMGLDSPMFDYLEQVSGVPQHSSKSGPISKTKDEQKPAADPAEARLRNEAERMFRKFTGGNIGVVSREKNQKSLAGVTLGATDIEVIKSYMQIIDEVCVNADKLADMKTEIAYEMFKYCLAMHARCMNIVAAKSAHGVIHQMDVLLSLSEDLDMRIKLYKNTFMDMAIRELSVDGKAKPAPKHEPQEEKKEPDGKEEVKEVRAVKPRVPVKPLPPPPSNPFFQFETKQEPMVDLLEELEERKDAKKPVEEPHKEEKKLAEGKSDGVAGDLLDINFDLSAAKVATAESVQAPPVAKKEEVKKEEVKKEEVKKQEDDFFENLANRKA